MLNLLNIFAATESGPAIHVAPAGVLEIAGHTITNSIVYGWFCALAIIILCVWVARQVTVKPKGGIIQLFEVGVKFISDLVENAFDDKKVGRKYAPFFVTIFFFILLNNWMGLLPFVGGGVHSGENPFFRPFTGDLNGTLAIGFFTMLLVYFASIKESGGPVAYIKHFFIGSPLNPLYLVIGLLEMLTDLTRVLSLSLRLFLNIAIGEIVIAVFAYLGASAGFLTALPFTLLEFLVAALQAYIFTILSTMYLAIAVNHANEHHEHADLTDDSEAETIEVNASASARSHA